jgi:hypothetical protein
MLMPSVSASAISQPRTAHQNSATMSGRTASIARTAMRLVMSPILADSQRFNGDASMALLDARYMLIGALVRDEDRFRTSDLAELQRPVRPERFTTEHVLAAGRGARFVKPARYYLFRRDS